VPRRTSKKPASREAGFFITGTKIQAQKNRPEGRFFNELISALRPKRQPKQPKQQSKRPKQRS